MFSGRGTLLVDDVTLLPGIHEEVAASEVPPQKGNRIFNSGFEAGPEGWTPTDGFVINRTTAHSGRCSARLGTVDLPSITLPLNRPLAPMMRPRTAPSGLECRPFPVRAGMRYTLSAWIKAAEPGTRVTLRFFEWADEGGDQPSNRNERKTSVTTTTDWVRYQFSGIALPNLWEDYVVRIVPAGRTPRSRTTALGPGAAAQCCRVGELRLQDGRTLPRPHPALGSVERAVLADFFSGTPEEYAELLKVAYRAIKRADPQAWSSADASRRTARSGRSAYWRRTGWISWTGSPTTSIGAPP